MKRSIKYGRLCLYCIEISGEWSTDGCITLDFDGNTTHCACTHATPFSADINQFKPNIVLVSPALTTELTPANIIKFPMPMLVCFFSIIFSLLLCQGLPELKSRPILAYNKVLPK